MVAPQQFKIAYSTDGSTYTDLSNVQEITADIGRRTLKDPFQPSRLTFTMRYPDGFYTPNTALVTGTWIRLTNVSGGTGYYMWKGKIANVTVEWGKTYNSTTHVGVSDYITVQCEGAMAEWGRRQGNNQAITEANAYYALAQVSSYSGLSIGTTYDSANSPLVSPTAVSSSYLDWINQFATTLSATVKDGSGELGVYTKDFVGSLSVNFSDTTNNAANQVYEDIELTSQVENYFTEVIVNPTYYAQQRVTSGSAPYRTLEVATYSGSASQALDLANYYLSVYKTPTLGISRVTCRSEAQNSWSLDFGYSWYDILGYRTNLTFRGTTYYMTILGSTMQATPAGSTFTFYLADNALNPWFVLNSATYGVLGTNRLSW
jgi:hypothetical protein